MSYVYWYSNKDICGTTGSINGIYFNGTRDTILTVVPTDLWTYGSYTCLSGVFPHKVGFSLKHDAKASIAHPCGFKVQPSNMFLLCFVFPSHINISFSPTFIQVPSQASAVSRVKLQAATTTLSSLIPGQEFCDPRTPGQLAHMAHRVMWPPTQDFLWRSSTWLI